MFKAGCLKLAQKSIFSLQSKRQGFLSTPPTPSVELSETSVKLVFNTFELENILIVRKKYLFGVGSIFIDIAASVFRSWSMTWISGYYCKSWVP